LAGAGADVVDTQAAGAFIVVQTLLARGKGAVECHANAPFGFAAQPFGARKVVVTDLILLGQGGAAALELALESGGALVAAGAGLGLVKGAVGALSRVAMAAQIVSTLVGSFAAFSCRFAGGTLAGLRVAEQPARAHLRAGAAFARRQQGFALVVGRAVRPGDALAQIAAFALPGQRNTGVAGRYVVLTREVGAADRLGAAGAGGAGIARTCHGATDGQRRAVESGTAVSRARAGVVDLALGTAAATCVAEQPGGTLDGRRGTGLAFLDGRDALAHMDGFRWATVLRDRASARPITEGVVSQPLAALARKLLADQPRDAVLCRIADSPFGQERLAGSAHLVAAVADGADARSGAAFAGSHSRHAGSMTVQLGEAIARDRAAFTRGPAWAGADMCLAVALGLCAA